ncbi:MAG: ribonuclease [Verrucomicrobia bacterium GWC2_42_7]|nr:MAG: ribonuclease [Verrucomicrobia bacterium GWC2_42_7]
MNEDIQKEKTHRTEDLKLHPHEHTTQAIPLSRLHEEARQRAKSQPFLQKIVKAFKGESATFRELIINTEPLERRVALLENGVLSRFEIERRDEERMVGSIFKGKIQNLEAGLKAAFVDIGLPKNAFLHYWDILPSAGDATVEVVRENQSAEQKRNRERFSLNDIPKNFPIGTEILVQITKTQIGTKGPRVTTNIALPGRYLVLMPYSGQCGISRKIEDPKERDRLKKIIRTLTIPEGMGVILRTASEGKKVRYFVRDLHILLKKWQQICQKVEEAKQPTMVYQEPDIIERTVRDFLTESIDRILADNQSDLDAITASVEEISPRSKNKISLFKDEIPIFERFNIERQIEQTFMRRVPLPSGGEIVIEETEALTAIDVNTSSHRTSETDGKDYILQANLEAAHEVSRQLRLRNIGGLIVIDFIDMKHNRSRKKVYDTMIEEMEGDKAKTQILPISQLGIMQMSRQRHSESTLSGVCTQCQYCQGRGKVKSTRSISVEIQRRIISHARRMYKKLAPNQNLQFTVVLHPSVIERFKTIDESAISELATHFNIGFTFRSDPNLHIENFKILNTVTNEELK